MHRQQKIIRALRQRTRSIAADDIRRCPDIGIQQLTFDYCTGRVEEMLQIIEHFAAEVVPAVGD